ncbi:hypothetical protein TrLO_g10756 [Triparma laevis f. longispina]|uniref:ODAD1 central coiled coil region domain-containing protein n=1 Tax=Triparma laevis f. longispina TaxID=1714387 RepID=A0A9W7KZP8_9STRA|nr:hypothetical protein TrLO_g10756 [Triparma laevis f. longispina]
MSHKRLVAASEEKPLHRVRKTKAELDHLNHNNEILKQDLARESRETKATHKLTAGRDMSRLQNDADNYAKRIEMERQKIEDLDNHIAMTHAKILAQRKKMGGADASQENNELIGRQVRMLENRLDKTLVKFNEALASNKQLRGRIDSMRQERVVFDGIYKKLERELHEKKKEMSAIIEDSNNAYQERDKAQGELKVLKDRAETDKAEFERDWKELGQLIEQDRKAREHIRAQIEKNSVSPVNETGRFSNTGSPVMMGDEVESLDAKNMMPGGFFPSSANTKEAPLPQEKVELYEEAFNKIADATGITDVDEVVSTFLEAEDKNFSLFNYVNELNSEIERLELAISDTKVEIEKYKGQGVSTDTQRKQILRNLDERLQTTRHKAEEYQTRYGNGMKTINQLKTGIHSIFSRLGCAGSNLEEMLGNQGVTESNMMQYLGIIEQKTSEILQLYATSQQNGEGGVDTQAKVVTSYNYGEPKMATRSEKHLTIEFKAGSLPSTNEYLSDEESDEENDERPLTRDELERKTMRGYRKGDKAKNKK